MLEKKSAVPKSWKKKIKKVEKNWWKKKWEKKSWEKNKKSLKKVGVKSQNKLWWKLPLSSCLA